MAGTYEIWLADPLGITLDAIDEFISLEYTRTINDIGSLTLVLDGDYNSTYLLVDGRITVWRKVGTLPKYIDTDTTWLIRKITTSLDQDGTEVIQVEAVSALEILSRRIVAYNAGTPYASKTGPSDDVMKELVSQNFGPDATDSNRDLSSYLSIAADLSQGPTIAKDCPRENVLSVLQDISSATIQAGSAVFFDIVSPTYSSFEFRTYRGVRGVDNTHPGGVSPVIISPDFGNLGSATRTYDWNNEITYAYAGGGGVGDSQAVETASSLDRINLSPFNRRETFVSVSSTSASVSLVTEAQAALRAGRPRRVLSGEVSSVEGSEYGIHWKWGDKVTVQFKGESVNSSIDSVTVSYAQGKETTRASLRVDEQ